MFFFFWLPLGHHSGDGCDNNDSRQVCSKRHAPSQVASVLCLHLVFITAMTQALCYHSWISDATRDVRNMGKLPTPGWRVEEPGLSETEPGA